MKLQDKNEPCILPVEIGYYGRPLSKLTKDELLDAFIELSRMYLELERKFRNYRRTDPKEKI
jgi:hypothetical protein